MSAFDKVIGYESIKAELIRYCDVLREPEKYWKLGVKRPSGILLYGEPGIGKTLMAEAFIEESGCKAFVLRKNKPDGSFVESAKRLRQPRRMLHVLCSLMIWTSMQMRI